MRELLQAGSLALLQTGDAILLQQTEVAGAGFLSPLFWLGLSASPYTASLEGNFCATVAMYPAMGSGIYFGPAVSASVDITSAMDADPDIRNC